MPEGAVIAERRDFVVNVLGKRGEGVGGVRIAGPGRHVDRGFMAKDVDLLAGQDPVHLVDSWNKKTDLVFPVVFLIVTLVLLSGSLQESSKVHQD